MRIRFWVFVTSLLCVGCATLPQQYETAIKGTYAQHARVAGSRDDLQQLIEQGRTARRLHGEFCASKFDEFRGCVGACPVAACMSLRDGSAIAYSNGLETVEVSGAAVAESSGTNNQESAVDEGDIVKRSGDYLFVLRDDALHAVRISDRGVPVLKLMARTSILEKNESDSAWYDEILVHGRQVILIGFNYNDEVTELLSFELREDGDLIRSGRYAIRSDDYFDGENYATRIVGDDLVFVISMSLEQALANAWPSWKRVGDVDQSWHSMIEPDQIHLPMAVATDPSLSMVVECPIATRIELTLCRARGVVTASAPTHYVSAEAVYLAIPEYPPERYADIARSALRWDFEATIDDQWTVLHRFAFDGHREIRSARIAGLVADQFQFKETARGLFVASTRADDNVSAIELRLIAHDQFVLEPRSAIPVWATHALDWSWHSGRFGTQHYWLPFEPENVEGNAIAAVALDTGQMISTPLPIDADRLQPMRDGMLVMNSWEDPATIAFVREEHDVLQIEQQLLPEFQIDADRSHAFNLQALDADSTLMCLVVDREIAGAHWNDNRRSDFAYLTWQSSLLTPLRVLEMQDQANQAACKSDCDEWYGNARAIPVDGRWLFVSGNLVKEAEWIAGNFVATRSVLLQ
jgi:hypothetical protein